MKANNFFKECAVYANLVQSAFLKIGRFYKNYRKNVLAAFFNSLTKQRRNGFIALNLFLSLYLSCVLLNNGYASLSALVMAFFVLSAVIFNLIVWFCYKRDQLSITITGGKKTIRKETVMLFALLNFIILCVSLAAVFPGMKSPDTENQWQQVQNFAFHDWHPVVHTLFIWLASRIINHYAFAVFVQIGAFSLGVGYLAATLEAWGFSRKIILLTGAFIILNPYTQNIMMYAWKDLAFTIFTTWLSIMMINIYLSRGKWLKKFRNTIVFSLTLGVAGMIRHNGIFFVVPLMCLTAVCYIKQTKKALLCPVLTVLVILIIRYPLYAALNVQFNPNQAYVESVGVPMTIMGDIMVKNPGVLTPEAKEFMNKIAADEEWRQKYVPGNYNSIKFVSNAGGVVADTPVRQFIKMVIDTAKNDKINALLAVRNVTRFVWQIGGAVDCMAYIHTAAGNNGLKNILNKGFQYLDRIAMSFPPLAYAWTKTGWCMFALMLFGIVSFSRNGASALLLVVPSAAYNLGTMLLLCGDDIRFFHFNVVITLPLVLALLSKRDDHEQKNAAYISGEE